MYRKINALIVWSANVLICVLVSQMINKDKTGRQRGDGVDT